MGEFVKDIEKAMATTPTTVDFLKTAMNWAAYALTNLQGDLLGDALEISSPVPLHAQEPVMYKRLQKWRKER